jgi:hypothetical protein
MIKGKKIHYYSSSSNGLDWKTACGRDGRKVGGLVKGFFKLTLCHERCKICDARFGKDIYLGKI